MKRHLIGLIETAVPQDQFYHVDFVKGISFLIIFILFPDGVEVEDDILDKFFEFQMKGEIYYVYHSIQRYMVNIYFQRFSNK